MINYRRRKTPTLRSRRRNGLAVKIITQMGWGLFLGCSLLAIISYRAQDNSWYQYSSTSTQPQNWLGILGANLAATYFYWWGWVAYLWALFLAALFYLSFMVRGQWRQQWERLAGGLGILLITSTLWQQGVFGWASFTQFSQLFGVLLTYCLGGVLLVAASTLVLRFAVGVYLYRVLVSLLTRLRHSQRVSAAHHWLIMHGGAVLKQGMLKLGDLIKAPFSWLYRLFWGAANRDLEQVLFQVDYQELYTQTNSSVAAQEAAENGACPICASFTKAIDSLPAQDELATHTPIYANTNTAGSSAPMTGLSNAGAAKQNGNLKPAFCSHMAAVVSAHDPVAGVNTADIITNSAASITDLTSGITNPNNQVSAPAFKLPDLSIFTAVKSVYTQDAAVTKQLQQQAKILAEKLKCFGVFGQVVSVEYGPVVSLFEFKPHIDSKVSKILALEHDLALALETISLRIIAPVPGKPVVGFEVANRERRPVYFGEIITAADFDANQYALPLILGQDTIGKNVTIDLARMPHLLIAGSTGSGKSVALNTMLTSLLCCRTPEQLRLILIDPKRLEFANYEAIPQLLFPITAEPRPAINILKWVVQEMEQRYILLAAAGVKQMSEYQTCCVQQQLPPLPYLVVVIDELADLMMTAGKEVENLIIRIAQKARAAGIHLIVATQRPSVDVITGLIKINFPSRVSFRVASKVDSRTILDSIGAEKLLGRGDMLFLDSQAVGLKRVHGAYVSNSEVQQIVAQLLASGRAQYLDLNQVLIHADLNAGDTDEAEVLLPEILTFLREIDEISISLLQRRFRIGYNRSARIIDTLESLGYLYQSEAGKPRRVNKGVLRAEN